MKEKICLTKAFALILAWLVIFGPKMALAADYSNIRAVYNYYTTEDNFLLFKEKGVNTVILKNEFDNNADYGNPIQLPDRIKNYALWAKRHDLMYFQGINFSHYQFANGTNSSIIPGNFNTVYEDGTISGHVSPWSEAFWQRLTDMTVALAWFAKYNSANYRIEGVFFDFEMYSNSNEPYYFDQRWGFEDQTFNQYILVKGLSAMKPPAGFTPEERSKRKTWLADNGKLADYYSFLSQTIYAFAKRLKDAVKATNPDFIIGAYPSCGDKEYIASIYSAFSSPAEPMIVWATETYGYGERGAGTLPDNLKAARLAQGYYDLSGIYGKPIIGWYVGGLLLSKYAYLNLDFYLYHIAKETNGYWIFNAALLTRSFEELREPDFVSYQLPYLEPLTRVRRTCQNANEHNRASKFCWQELKNANRELDKLSINPSYQTYLAYDLLSNSDQLNPLAEAGEYLNPDKIWFRGQHIFVIKAPEAAIVNMKLATRRIANYSDLVNFEVRDPANRKITQGTFNPDTEGVISFIAPETSNYSVTINPGINCFSLTQVNVPLMLFVTNRIHLFQTPGNIMFYVGDISSFTVNFEGEGESEGLAATIYQPIPGGYKACVTGATSQDNNHFILSVTVPEEARNKIWKVEINNPIADGQFLEDTYISFDQQLGTYFGITDNPQFFMRKDTSLPQYGDISGEKQISSADAELTARLVVGIKDHGDAKKTLADVSGDGQVNAFDAALITQKIFGLRDKFPVEQLQP